ncbi:MAG: phospholipase D-like domain-containing protein [Bacteriovorax sp.]|nr:phospholipase D-like domain-containing protein [Bacteriovorax sp.]
MKLIISAKKTIHLQTYIFMMDEFGKQVHTELKNAATRGVNVFLLVDGVGTRLLDKNSELELIRSGVHFEKFNQFQIRWLYSWGRRLHHKILLIDEEYCFTGGINVLQAQTDFIPQLDFALLIQGPALVRLTQYCQLIFQRSSAKKIFFASPVKSSSTANGVELKFLVNDWVYRRWQITKQYAHLTKKAKTEITIINSYFFPRKSFMNQLVAAAKRGVRVRLILPKFSDWPNYILASEFLYAYFLKNGVEIYLWEKSILHGKIATIDNSWATIGSFNLNYTSYQQNLEMNVNIYSEDFTLLLKKEINEIIANGCERLDPKDFINNCSLKKKSLRLFYYIVLSVIANLSIGLIFQEDNNSENKFNNLFRITGSFLFFVLGMIITMNSLLKGFPFFVISFFIFYKQINSNKKKETF